MAKRTIKKRRKWKFIPCLILCGLCGAILFEAGTLLAQFICASRDPFADYVIDPEKSLEEQLAELAKKDERAAFIWEHQKNYPEELLYMLIKDPDTLDFVYGYPDRSKTHFASQEDEIEQGTIPLLLQWDQRWGYAAYGDTIMALGGCAPTALAMICSGLLQDASITPYTIAQYAQDHGYYIPGVGSSWDLITAIAYRYGIDCSVLPLSKEAIYAALEIGHPIICSMASGDFTTSGHFIVLYDIEDGKIKVNDPNSKKRSAQLWEYDTLEEQISQLWVFCYSAY